MQPEDKKGGSPGTRAAPKVSEIDDDQGKKDSSGDWHGGWKPDYVGHLKFLSSQ